MKKAIIILISVIMVSTALYAQDKELTFNPVETESMLFLYNQTMIKGSDVEIMAPLQVKLRTALEKARTANDENAQIALDLNPQQIDICYQVLKNANFEAKYTELIYGMMTKLKEHTVNTPMQPVGTVN